MLDDTATNWHEITGSTSFWSDNLEVPELRGRNVAMLTEKIPHGDAII
jgi:hypothetical protein